MMKLYIKIIFGIICFDQLTKTIVVFAFGGNFFSHNAIYASSEHLWTIITSFLNLVYVWNYGVSFGLLSYQNTTSCWLIILLTVSIVTLLCFWLRSISDTWTGVGLASVIGGACGNIIDRIRFQAVLDFLDFHIGVYHWPAFNFADAFITSGTIIIFTASFLKHNSQF